MMTIRKVLPTDDFDAISHIYASSWKNAYKGIVPQTYLDMMPDNRWSHFLEQNPEKSVVALKGNAYVGTASFCLARDEEMAGWGELASIYLLPEHFGKGVGRPLLEAAIAELRALGCNKFYLWVLEENPRARAFYEKNGFVTSQEKKLYHIGGKELVEIKYISRG